ncbi:hypothetical protein AL065_23965 [Pseudomonas amygdali pv. ulmi]|nr:hypothetical protein AL065_23965 [Pseudomonas amygdali pv. ulmi]
MGAMLENVHKSFSYTGDRNLPGEPQQQCPVFGIGQFSNRQASEGGVGGIFIKEHILALTGLMCSKLGMVTAMPRHPF